MQDTAGKLRAGLLMTCLKSWWPADGAGTERASQLSQEKGGGYQGLPSCRACCMPCSGAPEQLQKVLQQLLYPGCLMPNYAAGSGEL